MAKTRIAIVGLGGVGGYFGGLLAHKYYQTKEVEVIFVVRPATKKVIMENGLKLITPVEEKVVYPDLATSEPELIGPVDFLICATKGYDLEEALMPLKDCITTNTSILPLLNGIDAKEKIETIFPGADVWDGCVYIVSRLVAPGVVQETGNIHKLYFGAGAETIEKQRLFEKICIEAGIECYLSTNITQTVWEKFLFISPMATATSYLNLSIGEILANDAYKKFFSGLIEELKAVADKIGIPVAKNIVSKTILRAESLPYETTSSMHSDFKKGGKTEVETLTGYVVRLGQKTGVATPAYAKAYAKLKGSDPVSLS